MNTNYNFFSGNPNNPGGRVLFNCTQISPSMCNLLDYQKMKLKTTQSKVVSHCLETVKEPTIKYADVKAMVDSYKKIV